MRHDLEIGQEVFVRGKVFGLSGAGIEVLFENDPYHQEVDVFLVGSVPVEEAEPAPVVELEKSFDVIAVAIKTMLIEVVAIGLTREGAESVRAMQRYDRAVKDQFMAVVPDGIYHTGDSYRGKKER